MHPLVLLRRIVTFPVRLSIQLLNASVAVLTFPLRLVLWPLHGRPRVFSCWGDLRKHLLYTHGLSYVTPNRHAGPNAWIMQRFLAARRLVFGSAPLIVYHGTPEENVDSILRRGLCSEYAASGNRFWMTTVARTYTRGYGRIIVLAAHRHLLEACPHGGGSYVYTTRRECAVVRWACCIRRRSITRGLFCTRRPCRPSLDRQHRVPGAARRPRGVRGLVQRPQRGDR